MPRVLDLLSKVAPNSSQAGEAKELSEKVEKGMSDAKARAEKVAEDQRIAEAPTKSDFHWASDAPRAAAPAAPTGPASSGPSLGMTHDELVSKFGDCFERRGDFEQGDKRGEAFGLLPACKAKFPSFAESIVVLIDNKVSSLVPLKDVNVRTADAGSPAPAQAAPAPPTPAAAPAAPAPPPQTVRYMPGGPIPQTPSGGAVAPAGSAPATPAPPQAP
jgi:hypothetical protein